MVHVERQTQNLALARDWARSLVLLHVDELGEDVARSTLNILLKFEQDIETAEAALPELLRAGA